MNSDQASVQVLKTVNTLAKLVQQATFSSVNSWDEKEFKNAFDWASHCQKIAKNITLLGETFRHCLEQKMAELGATLTPRLPRALNLAFLKQAVDIMLEALVYNPTLSNSQLDVMLELVRTHYSASVSPGMPSMAKILVLHESSRNAEKALKAAQIALNSDQSSAKGVASSLRLLFEQLTLFMAVSRRSCWFDCRLISILTRLTQCSNGWDLLVSSLCNDLRNVAIEKRQDMRQLFQVILGWISLQHQLYKTRCPLWQLPPARLANLAEFHKGFCNWYLAELEEIGDQLNKTVQADWQVKKKEGGGGNPLRETASPEECMLEERFQQLLVKDEEIRKKVLKLLYSKVKEYRLFSVWLLISCSLLKRNLGHNMPAFYFSPPPSSFFSIVGMPNPRPIPPLPFF